MKKYILILAMALTVFACKKEETTEDINKKEVPQETIPVAGGWYQGPTIDDADIDTLEWFSKKTTKYATVGERANGVGLADNFIRIITIRSESPRNNSTKVNKVCYFGIITPIDGNIWQFNIEARSSQSKSGIWDTAEVYRDESVKYLAVTWNKKQKFFIFEKDTFNFTR